MQATRRTFLSYSNVSARLFALNPHFHKVRLVLIRYSAVALGACEMDHVDKIKRGRPPPVIVL